MLGRLTLNTCLGYVVQEWPQRWSDIGNAEPAMLS